MNDEAIKIDNGVLSRQRLTNFRKMGGDQWIVGSGGGVRGDWFLISFAENRPNNTAQRRVRVHSPNALRNLFAEHRFLTWG